MHVSRQFDGLCFDRRECLMGLNCNTRINNIEGSNHNNNAIACNNNNLNANHSYSLFHLMCARVARACMRVCMCIMRACA